MEGIKALTPRISNIHTFHWSLGEEGKYIQHLLETGKKRWIKFLRKITKDGKDHAAMLEFVVDGKEKNFYKDAEVLKQIISEI